MQAGFHHLSRLTGTFEEFELSIFVGEIELAKLLAEVNVLLKINAGFFFAQKSMHGNLVKSLNDKNTHKKDKIANTKSDILNAKSRPQWVFLILLSIIYGYILAFGLIASSSLLVSLIGYCLSLVLIYSTVSSFDSLSISFNTLPIDL